MRLKTAAGAVLIIVSFSLAGAGVYALQALKKARFDPETLCPLPGVGPLTLILIDKTDPLTLREQDLAREAVSAERDALPRYGRLALKVLHASETAGAPVLTTVADLCNPGSEANPFLENPKKVAARYANSFLDPLDRALADMAAGGSASASPIAAAIEMALKEIPMPPQTGTKLILISDLMEHTPAGSAYSGSITEAGLERQMPHARGALSTSGSIKILLLPRPQLKKQQDAAVVLWQHVFRTMLGREAELVRL
jgi:hypothetical protein